MMFNNEVVIRGKIMKGLAYSHDSHGEEFYSTHICVERLSGYRDEVPVIIPERLIDNGKDYKGADVIIIGQFRSRNVMEPGKTKKILYVFADFFDFLQDENECNNIITLRGTICKEPTLRTTPNGRIISDLTVAVSRNCGKADFIPCVAWGRDAIFSNNLHTGERIELVGRVQSREYLKKFGDGSEETRVAYEVSVSRIDVLEIEGECK